MSGGSWFSRLFQGGDEQGKRRASDLAAFIGYPGLVLERHEAGGDLVSEPRLVWESAGEGRQGLRAQLLAHPEVVFTDLLLILSPSDFLRATATGGVPWLVRLQEELTEAYADLRRGYPLLPPRRLRVRMGRDGSAEVGHQRFGLEQGDFIVGLMPQLYTGRSGRSKEQLVVHLNLPAVDGEYRRIGQLYDDQRCFTLGSHWLDSYGHPELEQPGLFRIFRDAEGLLVYELRPELERHYQLEQREQAGVLVLSITRDGQALAHLVLESVAADDPGRDFRAEALQRARLSLPLEQVRARLAEDGAGALARERRPNSQIDSVIVFDDRAVVTRTRFVKLEQGDNEVRFDDLLPSLGARALEAEVRAGRARVMGVKTLSAAKERARGRGAVQREAEGIVDALEEVIRRVEELLQQRATVGRTVVPSAEDSHLGGLSGLRGRLETLRMAERRIDERISEVLERAASLDDRLAPLLRELEAPAAVGQVALITLRCEQAGSAEIALRYPVADARWSPRYTARLRSATSTVELECVAELQQTSGEDWQDAKLFLSPTLGGQRVSPPAVRPWTLEQGPELAALLAAQPEASLTVMSGGEGPAGEAELIEVPDRVSLADGAEARILVGVYRAASLRRAHAVPRVEAKVYRSARVQAWPGPRLPEGPLSCHVDEQYVGTGRLPALRTGERVDFDFGVDPALRVERLLVKRERRDGAPGQAVHAFHYRVYVHSQADEPVEVSLVEQLPVGGAQVRLEKAAASDKVRPKLDPRQGLLRWTLRLEAQGVVLADTVFTVGVRIGL